jgi:phosphotransferase system HPr-like phosphotransfer protein
VAQVFVNLNRGLLVKDFVNDIQKINGNIEILSGLATINARSALGIYCLDLSAPVLVHFENDTPENREILKTYTII